MNGHGLDLLAHAARPVHAAGSVQDPPGEHDQHVGADSVHLTVPGGYVLRPDGAGGYTLGKMADIPVQ
jgi:hypothetical protein